MGGKIGDKDMITGFDEVWNYRIVLFSVGKRTVADENGGFA